jgi:hypothetical protein
MKTGKDLLEFVNQNCPDVQLLPKPLTLEEADKLILHYPFAALCRQFQNMENYPKLNKTSKSAFLTCRKWFEMDEQRQNQPP